MSDTVTIRDPKTLPMMAEAFNANVEDRKGVWQLRRWCPYSETHCDPDWETCPWEECGGSSSGHRMRLRRMLVCTVSYCKQGYFDQKEFDEHDCGSAY